jgi:N-methylhydantoinase A/oxoprolinase/acetone carboxylase beta subunit
VIVTRGAQYCRFSSLRSRRFAAGLSRRLWTRDYQEFRVGPRCSGGGEAALEEDGERLSMQRGRLLNRHSLALEFGVEYGAD